MDTTAERSLIGVGVGLAVGLSLLVLAVPEAAPPPVATAAAPSSPLAAVARAPQDHAQLVALVSACQQADGHAVTELRQLAGSADAAVAGNAIAALARLGAVRADNACRAWLGDPRPRVLREAIVALGGSGDAAAAALLEPLLAGDDAQARLLAVSALQQLGAADRLQQLAADPRTDPATRAYLKAGRPLGVPRLLSTTGALPR